MRTSLLTLFALNLALVLFPVLSPDGDQTGGNALFFGEITLYGRILSSVLTPLLVVATLWFALFDGKRKPITGGILFTSLAVCLLMCVSAAFADTVRVETLFMGLFFLLFSFYLTLMKADPCGAEDVLKIFRTYFIVWLLAPIVAMLVDPSLIGMFVNVSPIDVSYHGLADSRVGFGLWVPAFIILLGKPKSKFEWMLMILSVLTLLLSQSRAAVLGLLLSCIYALLRLRDDHRALWSRLVALFAVCFVPLALWSTFGRDDALTVFSEDRDLILSRFLDFIGSHWVLGHGAMYLVDLPEIDKIEVPAHNFLLQTLANYGLLTLLAFLAYFVCVFRAVRSTRARMLLIFLFVYSMNQPVQGTGNFFNPITLLFFLLTFAVDNVAGRTARPARAHAPVVGSRLSAVDPTSA